MTASSPTRATVPGNTYLYLRAKARLEHRPTDELIQLYALEGFLDRLASTHYASRLIIKGGVVFAAYDLRRPTRDIDLQGQRMPNDSDSLLGLIEEVATIELSDGLVFDADTATAEVTRDRTADEYSGVRVTLLCALSTAKVVIHVDISVGDPIWPTPRKVGTHAVELFESIAWHRKPERIVAMLRAAEPS